MAHKRPEKDFGDWTDIRVRCKPVIGVRGCLDVEARERSDVEVRGWPEEGPADDRSWLDSKVRDRPDLND